MFKCKLFLWPYLLQTKFVKLLNFLGFVGPQVVYPELNLLVLDNVGYQVVYPGLGFYLNYLCKYLV